MRVSIAFTMLALALLALSAVGGPVHSADRTILIELPVTVLPVDVAASGSVVVGSYVQPSGI